MRLNALLDNTRGYNEDYGRFKGLSLNFKKAQQCRTDYISEQEERLIDLLKQKAPLNLEEHIDSICLLV